ncbi:MAG: ATP-binding protein [Pontiellaceae bacterium]|nr:ATP-binding protein [Pontiellaceae bacterium]
MPGKTNVDNGKNRRDELSLTRTSWYRQGVVAYCLMTVIPLLALGFFLVTYLLPNVVTRESLLLVIILCFVLSVSGLVILHNILASFYKFRTCIETVAGGNLNQETPALNSPDADRVAASINAIIERLQQDRLRLQNLLKEGQGSFRDIIKKNADGILIVDIETKVCTRANPAACRMFGYTADEMGTMNLFDLYQKKAVSHVAIEFEAQLKGEKTLAINLPGRRKDGTLFYVDVNATNALIDDKTHWVGFFRDVTGRKRAEEEICLLNEELEMHIRERTDELQAANQELDSFCCSVSNDLRRPLKAMDGLCHILMTNYSDGFDPEGRRVLGIISGESQRMGRLMDGLLVFSQTGRQLLKLETVEPNLLINRAVQELSAGKADNRQIEWKVGRLPVSRGDSALLYQVWLNLLSNAIKFTGKKDTAVIEIGSRVEDGQTVYYVKDNGIGFDMKYVSRLFAIFQRLHAEHSFEGIGVGLALIRRIVLRHGGRVWAEGMPDEGGTFYFSLPMPDRIEKE